MNDSISNSFKQRGIEIPFLDDIGLAFDSMAEGHSQVSLVPQKRHTNSWGVVHGGVVMTMLDVAMAMAGRSLQKSKEGGNVTVEMKTTFVRPTQVAQAGARVVARGHCYHLSTTMAFCEGEVLDDQGRICAKATGTFKFLTRVDATSRSLLGSTGDVEKTD
jgi:acyl-CoA thioesterase